MPLTTADIGSQILMDTTAALQEVESRMSACPFGAPHNQEQGPAVRQVLGELLDAINTDGRILLSAAGDTAGSCTCPLPTDPTTALDDAFLAVMHHVGFKMSAEQMAELMADDPDPFFCDG